MEIRVEVKTGIRKSGCREVAPGRFLVSVLEKPVAGRANEAVIEVLAVHFNVLPNAVSIIRGHQKRHKVAKISGVVH